MTTTTIGWFHIVFRKEEHDEMRVTGRFCFVSTQLPIRSKQVQWLLIVVVVVVQVNSPSDHIFRPLSNLACHIYHRRKKWNINGGVHSHTHTGIQRSCWYPKMTSNCFYSRTVTFIIYSSIEKQNNGLFYCILLFENRINLKLPCYIWEVPKVFRSICHPLKRSDEK